MIKVWNTSAYEAAVRSGWKAPEPKPVVYCSCTGTGHRQHCPPWGGPKDVWCGTCSKSVRPAPVLTVINGGQNRRA